MPPNVQFQLKIQQWQLFPSLYMKNRAHVWIRNVEIVKIDYSQAKNGVVLTPETWKYRWTILQNNQSGPLTSPRTLWPATWPFWTLLAPLNPRVSLLWPLWPKPKTKQFKRFNDWPLADVTPRHRWPADVEFDRSSMASLWLPHGTWHRAPEAWDHFHSSSTCTSAWNALPESRSHSPVNAKLWPARVCHSFIVRR